MYNTYVLLHAHNVGLPVIEQHITVESSQVLVNTQSVILNLSESYNIICTTYIELNDIDDEYIITTSWNKETNTTLNVMSISLNNTSTSNSTLILNPVTFEQRGSYSCISTLYVPRRDAFKDVTTEYDVIVKG